MTKDPETYFASGCGRCPRGGTPDCSVVLWKSTLRSLREVVLSTGLTEESKWGAPCYTFQGKNIASIGAFRERCTLGFFKGDLLSDTQNILSKAGKNSHQGRILNLTSSEQVRLLAPMIVRYLHEAIEIERSGVKRTKEKAVEPLPDELTAFFKENPDVQAAFNALTPGRQRSHLLHIKSAKQASTRMRRIESAVPAIRSGKGRNER